MAEEQLVNTAIDISLKQIEKAVEFRKPRLTAIQKNEDAYYLKTKPTLPGRIWIPLPIMAGFVDTLKSKIDELPKLSFKHEGLAQLKVAKKITAAAELISSPTRGKWAYKDRGATVLSIFSGRAIYKKYANSTDGFQDYLEVVDFFDFLWEPKGGADLDDHLFLGQQNIFKTKSDIEAGVAAGIYEPAAAQMIINSLTSEEKVNDKLAQEKLNRYRKLGLDTEFNNYIGQKVANFTEWCFKLNGEKYYLLFEPGMKQALRFQPLKEVISSNKQPYVSWATHEDPYNFASKAPADDIRPVADGMEIVFNEGVNNLRKRNWGQRAIDPNIFPNVNEFNWDRPDKVIIADTRSGERSIGSGIYEFKTDDNTAITVNLTSFLNNFLGEKTGVTPSSQGSSPKDTKVGVYYGDMAQVADRLGLTNKSKAEAWAKIGERFVHGVREHLSEPLLVKMIGTYGVEWDELNKSELSDSDEFDIAVSSGAQEAQQDQIKSAKRSEALKNLSLNPHYQNLLAPQWVIEQTLLTGGYDKDEVKQALDQSGEADMDIISEADRAVELILKGKEPKPNRGATTTFIQYILDYATDNDLKAEIYAKLITYAKLHFAYAKENAVRKAMRQNNTPPATAPVAVSMPVNPGSAGFEVPKPSNPAITP